jgi:hypothetical protein
LFLDLLEAVCVGNRLPWRLPLRALFLMIIAFQQLETKKREKKRSACLELFKEQSKSTEKISRCTLQMLQRRILDYSNKGRLGWGSGGVMGVCFLVDDLKTREELRVVLHLRTR